eukprot:5078817-Pleurochrysis_carterae.AAC.1
MRAARLRHRHHHRHRAHERDGDIGLRFRQCMHAHTPLAVDGDLDRLNHHHQTDADERSLQHDERDAAQSAGEPERGEQLVECGGDCGGGAVHGKQRRQTLGFGKRR